MRKVFLAALMVLTVLSVWTARAAIAAPVVEINLRDDVGLYNAEIISSLSDRLARQFDGHIEVSSVNGVVRAARENEAVEGVTEVVDVGVAPAYRVEMFILSMGMGKLVNNGLSTTISLGGSMASIFISPLSGSALGTLGWIHATKPVFAVSVNVKVIRLSDGEILYNANRLGRSNVAKKDERPPLQVIADALEDTAVTVARPLVKDSARSAPRIFK